MNNHRAGGVETVQEVSISHKIWSLSGSGPTQEESLSKRTALADDVQRPRRQDT